tara:strand:- start:938 stop:1981 length:1044 start_codon:yes stop_codon:yes gene_type:complete
MRAGLKNRVNGNQYYLKTNTLSQILSEKGISKLTINSRVNPDPNFCAPGSCEDFNNGIPFDLERRNHYYAPFRQPVKGYRKTIDCDDDNPNCLFTTEIYKDTYVDCSFNLCKPMTYTSLPTSNKPNASTSRANSGISARAGRPLIRSGMQPNSSGQQNSGLDVVTPGNPKKYSYSYRELLNNRRKVTYEKKLPTKLAVGPSPNTSGYGGLCDTASGCSYKGETIFKPNNDRYMVQGAVDSSDRITRLKLNTIKSGRRCGPAINQACRGIYRSGNAQTAVDTLLWPSPNNDYDQIKYKTKFNSNHFEVNYPQVSALARVRGNVSKSKTNFSKNNTICCDDPNKSGNNY